jgi:hypothetical protein
MKRIKVGVFLLIIGLLTFTLSIGLSGQGFAAAGFQILKSSNTQPVTVVTSQTAAADQSTARESTMWWEAFQTGFAKGFLEIALVLPLSILLTILTFGIAMICQKLLYDTRLASVATRIMRGQEKLVAFSLILFFLLVLVPVALLLFWGLPFSIEHIARYVMELLISTVLLVMALGVARKLLAREESLNSKLLALDRNEIKQFEVEDAQQIYVLEKWIQGDETGWYALQEMVRYNGGLRPAVKAKLEHLRQAHPEKAAQLQLLLS